MKNRVITIFLVSFFSCCTTIINANDSIPETTNVRADSINQNQDSISALSAPNVQIVAEKRESEAIESARKDSIAAKEAEKREVAAIEKARKDSISAANAEIARKDALKQAREAEKKKSEAIERARKDSIAAKEAEKREVAAIEKARKDSISAANALREKEQAKQEAKRAKILLEKVIRYLLVVLFFCLIIIVVVIVVSRYRKMKSKDEKMSLLVVPDVEKEQKPLDKNKNEEVISQPKHDDSVQSTKHALEEGENDIVKPEHRVEALTSTSIDKFIAKWVVVGASVKGNGHIQSNMPCQDNNMFESLDNGWGIAIVSDGAGSAAHSDLGSKIVVTRGIFHFKKLIENEGWVEKKTFPTDIEWLQKSYAVLKDIRTDVMMVAKKNNTDVKSLSATCLVVIYSPYGLLTVHVGDGRMGYKTLNDEWKPMMTPHKGEEANQTIFLVSDFWSIPQYTMSGVLVPESIVVREPIKAFALMSDGCENTAWQCTALNSDTGKYFDRNLPYAGFFNPLEETLLTFSKDNVPVEERQAKWFKFIESGTSGFVKEQDDKTMIYAVNVELMK